MMELILIEIGSWLTKKRICWQITKLELLKHFETTEDQVQSAVEHHIDGFIERIHSRLTDPLRQRIQNIRRELQASHCNIPTRYMTVS